MDIFYWYHICVIGFIGSVIGKNLELNWFFLEKDAPKINIIRDALFHLLLIITYKATYKVTLNFHLYHNLRISFKFAKFENLQRIFVYWKSISELRF